MSKELEELEEREERAWNTVLEDMQEIRQSRKNNLPQLTEMINDADPFLIRIFTGSRQFKNMKDSLLDYKMKDLGGRLTINDSVAQMKRAAEQLHRYANTYLNYKNGEGRNPNERRRIETASVVRDFAVGQLQILTRLEGHLEDWKFVKRTLDAEQAEEEYKMFRNRRVDPLPEQSQNVEQKQNQNAEPEQNQNAKPEQEVDTEYEEAVMDEAVMDDAELEEVYKETFCVNGKRAVEGGFTDISSCIKYILRELRNLFLPDEKTYERLGLRDRHDSEEPLSPEARKTAEKLMKYMTAREVLYKEQEQRQAEEKEEPSLLEKMSEDMEPEEFMSLVTKTQSFQSALEHMTCAGIYNFVAEENSDQLKKLAGKVRAEMPQTARQYLIELQGEPSKTEVKEPVNKAQKESEVRVFQAPH